MKMRFELDILGRVIGAVSGWDQSDTMCFQYYDFVPAAGVNLPKTDCLEVDFDNGRFETFDDEDNVTFQTDIINTLRDIPVKVAEEDKIDA